MRKPLKGIERQEGCRFPPRGKRWLRICALLRRRACLPGPTAKLEVWMHSRNPKYGILRFPCTCDEYFPDSEIHVNSYTV